MLFPICLCVEYVFPNASILSMNTVHIKCKISSMPKYEHIDTY